MFGLKKRVKQNAEDCNKLFESITEEFSSIRRAVIDTEHRVKAIVLSIDKSNDDTDSVLIEQGKRIKASEDRIEKYDDDLTSVLIEQGERIKNLEDKCTHNVELNNENWDLCEEKLTNLNERVEVQEEATALILEHLNLKIVVTPESVTLVEVE